MIQKTPFMRFKEKLANKLNATTYRPYSESEAKIMIERYQQDDFLTPKQKELYDMMREQFEKIHPE